MKRLQRWQRDVVRAAVLGVVGGVLVACPGPTLCSVEDNGDGTATIRCPDGTSVVIRNGSNGTPGTDGQDGQDGQDGISCSVSLDPVTGVKTITCTDGTRVDVDAAVEYGTLTMAELAVADMSITVLGITSAPRPVVTFVVRDGKGKGVRGIPPSNFPGIALLQLVPGNTASGGNGLNIDTWVSHITNCATCTPDTETATASSLVDRGNGVYEYTFQKDVVSPIAYDGGTTVAGVAFDASAPHRFGMRMEAAGNPFRPVDVVYDYIPATGANITGQNDKVSTASCLVCHMQWRANALNAGGMPPFHAGQRYETQYCLVCHNDQRKYAGDAVTGNAVVAEPTIDALGNLTPPPGQSAVHVLRGEAVMNMPVWVHKIHTGHRLTLKGPYVGLGERMNDINFPQSTTNCTKCHRNTAQADNWKNKPSRRACGGCHDDIDFNSASGGHVAGPRTNDSQCSLCHTPDDIVSNHLPLHPIDPNNIFLNPSGSANTNAAVLGSRFSPPPGGVVFTYTMPDAGVRTVPLGDGGVNAQVTFKLNDGTEDVVFRTPGPGVTELMDNFVGSPSIYCAFAMPQDGIGTPADFNATVSSYLRDIWRGTATGSGRGTIAGPDVNGFYTVTLTGVTIPPSARMLTCGIGYSYNISRTPPLTQTNLPEFPYDAGTQVGGLSIPPANVWQVATGYTGRRGATDNRSSGNEGQIVGADRCNNCHGALGVTPSFHGGQRNDGATCAFCHTQNRTSSGWSAGSESFIHAIHGGGKRTVPFNWHAISEVDGFFKIAFPGRPQLCEGCHNPGYYDFSADWYTDENVETRLPQTVAQGVYNGLPTLPDGGVNTGAWSISPYVIADNVYSYGSGYSYNTGTQVITQAAPTTLVNSPIANACFGCHDANRAILHFRTNGGQVYEPRGPQPYVNREQCLLCHGPGKIVAIKAIHAQ